tara:strand:- start:8719 stop:9237 length:519 start_codon:yes stop_codon:yes gene_type:complete
MSQHDETRRMLGLIRENLNTNKKNKTLLREQSEVKDDIDLGEEDSASLVEEEKKFRDTVTPRVEFNRFKLYPKAQNVEFSGKFTSNNLEWFYSLDDTNGVYITADLLQLDQSSLEQIQKLVAYYDTWSNEWATKIAEEYKNEVVDEENAEEGPEPLETEENLDEPFGGEGEL